MIVYSNVPKKHQLTVIEIIIFFKLYQRFQKFILKSCHFNEIMNVAVIINIGTYLFITGSTSVSDSKIEIKVDSESLLFRLTILWLLCLPFQVYTNIFRDCH